VLRGSRLDKKDMMTGTTDPDTGRIIGSSVRSADWNSFGRSPTSAKEPNKSPFFGTRQRYD